ncbi:hypothetical protein [Polyangium jinanense]|uniref:Uncharacterized protein n=1 Tax=Polyangium jinanense TaxID=2829994 RepID=A0A9X4ATY9_9BACT|nr:hypothetical protein [Polyangium jinanense]MDC3957313.1 hypothetical protein [Polyangium jinanense]MDC3982715.1 hypothetical protein [Polyangium jinanense]
MNVEVAEDRRSFASYGEILDVIDVGRVRITRRYGCIRRDQFELVTKEPFPSAFRDWLASRGELRERPALYVIEVPGAYQLTVAPRAGRAILMPRLATDLTWQARAAREIAETLDRMLNQGSCLAIPPQAG